jgi:hypothetical protein
VSERDENTEAVQNVEKATDSEPVQGEDVLESEELKQKLREAKKYWRKALELRTRRGKTAPYWLRKSESGPTGYDFIWHILSDVVEI